MPFYSLPTGGSPVLAGSGAPTGAVGNVGDLFIDQSNKMLYGPKTIGGWPSGPVDLSNGPTGASGVTGVTGATGAQAFAATGPTAPSGAGVSISGSVWLDDTTGKYFIRYGSTWIEVGVQGERGPNGPTGSGATGPAGPAGTYSDPQPINAQTASYTLALGDAGKLVTASHATNAIAITVPAGSSVAFPVGTHVDVVRLGAGNVNVTGATGVTINGTPGLNLRAQYSSATLIEVSSDSWLIVGDLST